MSRWIKDEDLSVTPKRKSREEEIEHLLQDIWDTGPGFNREGSDYNPQILRVLILIAAELAALNDTLKGKEGT